MTKGKARNLILFGFIFLILPLLFSVLNLYTDWLFFTETGYTSVFIKTLSTKIGTGLSFGIAFLFFVLVNITIANRTNFPQGDISVIEGVINPFRAARYRKGHQTPHHNCRSCYGHLCSAVGRIEMGRLPAL